MACTNLAAKIEENARRVRDVINVFHHIKQVRSGRYVKMIFKNKNHFNKILVLLNHY